MRSVSIAEDFAPAVNSLEEAFNYRNDFFYMKNNDAVTRLQSAIMQNPKGSLDKIAQDAGFTSRKAVSYYFGTRKKLLASVGIDLKSPEERLLEAAKTLSASASSREITKKAGYKSHKIIGLEFGSLEELKKKAGTYECNKEKINFEGVEFSPQDISRGITIPLEINGDVAEEAGWHAGDGSLYKKDGTGFNYCMAGDKNEEKDFYDYVSKQIKKIYNIKAKPHLLAAGKSLGIKISSKAIYTYKNNYLEFPRGEKADIVEVPVKILNSNNEAIKLAFVRGLADTDFSLTFSKKHKARHCYPSIVGSMASKTIIDQAAKILVDAGFKVSKSAYKRKDKNTEYILRVFGSSQLEKWIIKISFSNSKHMTKYLLWKKFGFCPPKTTIEQRKLILEGELDPNSFYEVKESA